MFFLNKKCNLRNIPTSSIYKSSVSNNYQEINSIPKFSTMSEKVMKMVTNLKMLETGVIFCIKILILLVIVSCSGNSGQIMRRLEFEDKVDKIEITGTNYAVIIDKTEAAISLYKPTGEQFTTFPLKAQYSANKSPLTGASHNWIIEKRTVTLQYMYQQMTVQVVKLVFSDDGFEVEFGVKLPDAQSSGLYCFKQDETGFDKTGWTGFFSPEPDEFYAVSPTVDISANNDNQWISSPAPLNISAKTRAGWFSIGLAQLPPAMQISFRQSSFFIDYPWEKLNASIDGLYHTVPMVFTFNNSEWIAISDYRDYLKLHGYLPERAYKISDVKWWRQPLLSTWGEQVVKERTRKAPGFNSEWVKEYVKKQSELYRNHKFTIVIENQWMNEFGDGAPSERFSDMKQLIQWCHERGHKVILWWRAWTAEANSLAQTMKVVNGDYVDATHPQFAEYVQKCCALMLSNADTALNADGLKIDEGYQVREPRLAHYTDSTKGMGLTEYKLYLKTFYEQAKLLKPDALILGYAIDPHFIDVQDMVSINNDWDNKLRREKRARIINAAAPELLVDGDVSDMTQRLALYHYVTSSIYATPAIEYLTQFQDLAIEPVMQESISQILDFYQKKGKGYPVFMDYGWWQWRNGHTLVAEAIAKGTALLYYKNKSEAELMSFVNQDVPLLIENARLLKVKNDKGKEIEFETVKRDVYKIPGVEKNKIYHLRLRPKGKSVY